MVPLFKSKSKSEYTNYRPISLLLTISKVLEKLIHRIFFSFFDKDNLIYNSQMAFKTNIPVMM